MIEKLKLLIDILKSLPINNLQAMEIVDYNFQLLLKDENLNKYPNEVNELMDVSVPILQNLINKNIDNEYLLNNINNYISDKIPNFLITEIKNNNIENTELNKLKVYIHNILLIYLLTVRNSKYLKLKNTFLKDSKLSNKFIKNNDTYKQIINYIMVPLDNRFINLIKEILGIQIFENNFILDLYIHNNENYISIKKLCKYLIDCFRYINENNITLFIQLSYELLNIVIVHILQLQEVLTTYDYPINKINTNNKMHTILKIRSNNTPTNILNLKTDNNSKIVKIKYDDNNYLFGPFDDIYFGNNKEIIDKSNYFINKLNNNESICIIGYGASGAGKTSTLIARQYIDTNNTIRYEYGIVYHILQQFINKFNLSLKINITELYYEHTQNICKTINKCENIEFININNEWVNNNISIINYILDILNNLRITKYTPNNPVSSRSHVIINILLDYNDVNKNTSLIICDFAGVENKFQCDAFNIDNNILIKSQIQKEYELQTTYEYKKSMEKNFLNKLNTIKKDEKFNEFILSYYKPPYDNHYKSFTDDIIDIYIKNPNKLLENLKTHIKTLNKDKRKALNYFNIDTFITQYKTYKHSIINLDVETKKLYNKNIKDYINFLYFYYGYNNYIKNNKNINLKLQKKYCEILVNEGQFINDSLADFRVAINNFISEYNNNLDFVDECLPLQCNPYYEDCFGKNKKQVVNSILFDNIIKNTNINKLNFCILNVINLNSDAHNITNKYVDISDLIYEYQRIKNYKYRMKYLPQLLNSANENKINTFLEFNKIINDYYSSSEILNKNVLINLQIKLKSNEYKLPNQLTDNINKYINNINNYLNTYNLDMPLDNTILTRNFNDIINEIQKYNSITLIGTMEFLDLMAKYGLNYTICNFKNPTNNDINNTQLINLTKSFNEVINTKLLKYKYFDKQIY